MEEIRNFSIIAHVDHGKSTLADRILELTGAIEKRRMREQVLDRMDLERERGITIKMQPVSVMYRKGDIDFTLNIIDTPGHIDFSYEVSRSLRAVEGALLLVDSTQGVQAQTLSVLEMARDFGLVIVPVLTKIDMPHARVEAVSLEVADLLGCSPDRVQTVSGKTGEGVGALLDTIVDQFPPPEQDTSGETRALVFDFSYTNHTGINAFARLFGGSFRKGDSLMLRGVHSSFIAKDVGVFRPDMSPVDALGEGMIGYITTGIKEPGVAVVGDTVTRAGSGAAVFPGYQEVSPVIWASLYPQDANQYTVLHHALKRMRLSDAAFTYEEEQSAVFGKGFRCGFLGMLHLEIITERVRREASVDLVITSPSTDFTVTLKDGMVSVITTPSKFPDSHAILEITEPWVSVSVIAPSGYVASVSALFSEYEGIVREVRDFRSDRCVIQGEMPLRELMRKFFDRLKSVSSGYASLSYTRIENRPSQVTRLDILLAEELFPAFSGIVSRSRVEREARVLVEILYGTVPRALFAIKVQARSEGRIIASKTLSALRKDVTAKLYGGDITRKMKLREKQKKGKRRMDAAGKVHVSHDTFLKVLQKKDQG